jgi:hypothetical protein
VRARSDSAGRGSPSGTPPGAISAAPARHRYCKSLLERACGRRRAWDATSLGDGTDAARLWVLEVDRPVSADLDPGLDLCGTAPTRQRVDIFPAVVSKNGRADDGAPGPRGNSTPDGDAAFVTDPDGYRLEPSCTSAT